MPEALSGCLPELVNNRFREQLGTVWKDGDGATALTDSLAFSQLYCGHFLSRKHFLMNMNERQITLLSCSHLTLVY